MTLRRGFSRRGPLVSQRRQTSWSVGPGSSVSVQSISGGSALIGAGAQSQIDGLTLVRLRGELLIVMRSAATLGDSMVGAFGIGIVQAPAFTAGITAVPTPITEIADENWIYHQFFNLFAAAVPVEAGNAGSSMIRVQVDSKAMRKFDSDRVLYAAIELVEVGAVVIETFFDSRILSKLA